MARTNKLVTNIVGGEVSPNVYGRVDLPTFQKGLAKCQNFIVMAEGGGKFRSGTVFVKNTRLNKKATFIEFCFNDLQTFLIEATDQKFRFYTQNSAVLEADKVVVSLTNANPGVFNVIAHGYGNGDEVQINGTGTAYDGAFFLVAVVDVDNFSLTDLFGNSIDSTNYAVYSGSGGVAGRVYEIVSPYAEADLPFLSYAQNADTMYIVHQLYAPQKLIRTSNTNWTLSTPVFVTTGGAHIFNSATHYPAAVAFIDSARLLFVGTLANPETIWASKAPSVGNTNFEDFTPGAAATDGIVFTLAPVHGKVDAIQWATSTSKFIILGTFGSMRLLYGATITEPISPTSVTAKSINSYGCMRTPPIGTGTNAFYIQRGGRLMRSVEYDILTDSYVTVNRNQVSEHLTETGYKKITLQEATRDAIWCVMNDGRVRALTFSQKEDISGWHRHYLGGNSINDQSILVPYARVLWAGTMPRVDTGGINGDQIWFVVERQINGNTVRTVEFFDDEPKYPVRHDFFTGDETADDTTFQNVLYEAQKDANHLDMSLGYDGSAFGSSAASALTPTATTGNNITITASAAVFTTAMVGRQIWKEYEIDGSGGGRAEITAFTDDKTVTCKVLSDFDNTNAMAAGQWYLTARTISGLSYLEGETVQVMTDGGIHADSVVANGRITLGYEASKVVVGYKYRGIIEWLNLDSGGVTGPAEAKPRNIYRVGLRLLNSLGIKFGTSLYNLQQVIFRNHQDRLDRPSSLFTGLRRESNSDSWDYTGKNFVVVQDQPLPCTILSLDCFMDTSDDQ